MSTIEHAIASTRLWIEQAVIGLNLCPFVSSIYRQGRVRIVASEARSYDQAIASALAEVSHLLETPEQTTATTLIVYPYILGDFDAFLDAAYDFEELMIKAGTEGILQLATFHPDYLFEDSNPDDPANWTNRSPFPTFHLLREENVSDAIDQHPAPEGIPDRNMALVRSMGLDGLHDLWTEWLEDDHSNQD
ncbi:MAG: DUF1415 domain-containing protein [Myxococcota bacterium]